MHGVDPVRLGDWFGLYGRTLVLYARQWLGREAAEDVVQEIFLRLCSAATPLLDPKHWLFRAVRNAAIDRLRRQHRRTRHEQTQTQRRPAWFESRPEDLLDAGTVQRGLEHLPTEQREIIILRIWGEMTFAEAAGLTGDPVTTLSSRYQAGLESLRQRMEATCNRNPKT